MDLHPYQRQIENIYEVHVPHVVDEYLISDPALARELQPGEDFRETPEKLLVHEDDEGVGLSLYLDPDLIARLEEDDPLDRLHPGNLEDYCLALEGVSHFVYLVWNASHARSVSLLELEMQAEVDKFVTAAVLFGHQGEGRIPGDLSRWLFDNAQFAEELDDEERDRYRYANAFAARYCARLESRYLRSKTEGGLISELRRFYRMSRGQKIDRARA